MARWYLKIKQGDTSEQVQVLGSPLTIGRSPDNKVVLSSRGISRKHSQLSWNGRGVVLEDLKSSNGTWLAVDGTWRSVSEPQEVQLPAMIRLAEGVTIEVAALDSHEHKEAEVVEVVDEHETSLAFSSMDLAEREEQVAIMVLDLCSSTYTGYSEGNLMGYHLKYRLEEMTTPVLDQYKVAFKKSTGDGFLVTFSRPDDALMSSRVILDKLARRNAKTTNPPIEVRIGLHFGSVYRIGQSSGGDLHGNDVNLTFRLEGLEPCDLKNFREFPHNNRMICSENFLRVLTALPAVEELGEAHLKGVPAPVDLFLIR